MGGRLPFRPLKIHMHNCFCLIFHYVNSSLFHCVPFATVTHRSSSTTMIIKPRVYAFYFLLSLCPSVPLNLKIAKKKDLYTINEVLLLVSFRFSFKRGTRGTGGQEGPHLWPYLPRIFVSINSLPCEFISASFFCVTW